MWAPGGVVGRTALEVAIGELAYKLGIDPLALRLRDHAARDHNADKLFSSEDLLAYYQQAAKRFGWINRSYELGYMKRGNTLAGDD